MMSGAYYPHHISVSSLKEDKNILAARVVNLQTMLDQQINKIKVVATILNIDLILILYGGIAVMSAYLLRSCALASFIGSMICVYVSGRNYCQMNSIFRDNCIVWQYM